MDSLTNLLPASHQRSLAREYLLRILVVGAVVVTMLTLSAIVLLIPTYVFLTGNEQAKREQLAHIESTITPADEAMLSSRLTTLSHKAAALTALSKTLSVSQVVRDILAVSRPGITLSEFSYTPSATKNPGTLTVSGSSATREALRSYQLSLQGAPRVRSAALPVSAYAKDVDIAFTITITLAP